MIKNQIAFMFLAACAACAQGDPNASHHAAVAQRGDHEMGFSHENTTHHFLLYRDGGAIEVTANDPADTESRDQIRMHLGHIAKMFASGDFDVPMLVHDKVPPGTPVMARLKSKITYVYEKTDRGGRVRIKTKSAEALAAVHEFLRFQITDHQTGDPLTTAERLASL
jgi:hypothetical protein